MTWCRSIDWDCEVQTLFQEANLGCGLGVSTAITWFFAKEERGIILEDDIIPDPSRSSRFCAELLERYEDDERVFAISGCNFVPAGGADPPDRAVPLQPGAAHLGLGDLAPVVGAASTRHRRLAHAAARWAHCGRERGTPLPGAVFWASTFELLARKEVDTWDGQLVLASMVVAPAHRHEQREPRSRTSGSATTATHTVEDLDELRPVEPIALPTAPVARRLDAQADAWTRKHHFRATWRGMLDQADRYRKQRRGRTS